MKRIALKMIRVYQNTLSLDHGPLRRFFPGGYCRFQPTCSQYTYESVKKYGLIKGGMKGLTRIGRCNPWGKGGWDPIDNSKGKMKKAK